MMNSGNQSELNVPLNPNEFSESNGTTYAQGYHNPNEGNQENMTNKINSLSPPILLRYMRYANVGLSIFQGLTGFLGLFDLAKLNITSFLIAVYVIIFALLLLAFECRFKSMEPTIRKNFGFLFTYRGRALFIFFVGFLDFGMADAMAWVAGVLMCLNACINFFVICYHPGFRSGELTPDMDPTAGYTTGQQEATQFFAQNPELAKRAGQFAFEQAKQNPELAKQVVRSQMEQGRENNHMIGTV